MKQTQRGLELYGLPALYPKRSRDAFLVICTNRGLFSMDEVNEILNEHGEEELNR